MGIEVISAQPGAAITAGTGQPPLRQNGQVLEALLVALRPNGQVLFSSGGVTLEAVLRSAGSSSPLAAGVFVQGTDASSVVLTPGSRVLLEVISGGGRAGPLPAGVDANAQLPLVLRLLPSPGVTPGSRGAKLNTPAQGEGAQAPATGLQPVAVDARIAAAQAIIRLAEAPISPVEAHDITRGIVPEALARQESHARLFATVAALLERPLPPAVKAAALALQGLRLPTDGTVSAPRLEAAIRGSGVFLENTLARAVPNAPPPQDFKAAVLALRQAVAAWPVAASAASESVASSIPSSALSSLPVSSPRARPPLRGSLPVGQPPQDAGDTRLLGDREVAHLLAREADAALARIELSQFASLEVQAEGSAPVPAQTDRQWTFELPLALGNQTAVAQFQLLREWEGAANPAAEGERAWRVRFSLATMPEGTIDAQIFLRGGRVAVTLWAEREGTAANLNHELPELVAALEEAALVLNSVQVRHGRPVAPALAPGQLLDSHS